MCKLICNTCEVASSIMKQCTFMLLYMPPCFGEKKIRTHTFRSRCPVINKSPFLFTLPFVAREIILFSRLNGGTREMNILVVPG